MGGKRKRVAVEATPVATGVASGAEEKKQRKESAPLSPTVKGLQGHGKHNKNGKKHLGAKAKLHLKEKSDAKAAMPPAPPIAAIAGSNWLAMKQKIQQKNQKYSQSTEKKHDLDVNANKQKIKNAKRAQKQGQKTAQWIDNSLIVAMDCEMVGVGLTGKQSVLARCSIVDYEGNVLYDKAVRPVEKVTDFRTHVSGIRSRTLKNAIPFTQALKEVGKVLKDKIVVGHALANDFKALMFAPPKHLIRDTAKYRPYMRRKMNGTKLYPKSLKHLAEEVLGLKIQTGEHDSVEDARATLELYKREQFAWEKYLRTSKSASSLVGIAPALPKAAKSVQAHPGGRFGEDDEGTDSENEFGAKQATAAATAARFSAHDSKELAITEFAE